MTTVMICLDISVVNTVNHHILKSVMENLYGIESMPLKWISSIWKMDNFVVQTFEVTSAIKDINHLVPEGSIIGSLLFSCYVSTLQDNITRD